MKIPPDILRPLLLAWYGSLRRAATAQGVARRSVRLWLTGGGIDRRRVARFVERADRRVYEVRRLWAERRAELERREADQVAAIGATVERLRVWLAEQPPRVLKRDAPSRFVQLHAAPDEQLSERRIKP